MNLNIDIFNRLNKKDNKYLSYLKRKGITDSVSLTVASKYKNIKVPTNTDLEIEKITDFKKYTLFVYNFTLDQVFENGIDVIRKGVPIPNNNDINSVCTKCPNFWILMNTLVSINSTDMAMIVKIPNDELTKADIYYRDGLTLRLLPEYNYGLAMIDRNNRLLINRDLFDYQTEYEDKNIRLAK